MDSALPVRWICPRDRVKAYSVDLANSEGGEAAGSTATLLLTDGWYTIRATLDALLTEHLVLGKIFVGQKLHVFGAQVHVASDTWFAFADILQLNCSEPSPPLDAPASTSLSISINGTQQQPETQSVLLTELPGTRRAEWDVPLGFQRKMTFSVNIRSICPNGGVVPAIDVVILRAYPLLYYERNAESGEKIAIRNEQGEREAARKFEARSAP